MRGVAQARTKRAELYRLCAPLATTQIIGAIGALPPCGQRDGNDALAVLHFTLIAWKPADGALQQGRLQVEKTVTDAELDEALQQLRTETIYRLDVKIAPGNPFGAPRALFVSNLGPARDDEVMRELREYQKPMSIAVEPFGTFTLNRSIDWLSVHADWCGRTIELAAEIERREDAASAIGTAQSLWQHMPEWDSRMTRYAADHLVAPENQSFLRDADREASAEELARRMQVQSLTVYPNQRFEAWCVDGDLFRGYVVAVRGSIAAGLQSAEIIG